MSTEGVGLFTAVLGATFAYLFRWTTRGPFFGWVAIWGEPPLLIQRLAGSVNGTVRILGAIDVVVGIAMVVCGIAVATGAAPPSLSAAAILWGVIAAGGAFGTEWVLGWRSHRRRDHLEHQAITRVFRRRVKDISFEQLAALGDAWAGGDERERFRRERALRDLGPWTEWDRQELDRLERAVADDVLERSGSSPATGIGLLLRDRSKEIAAAAGRRTAVGVWACGVTASAVWLRRGIPSEQLETLTAPWRATLGDLPVFDVPISDG